MKRISYDYTNLMADVVGERGIRDEDLDTIAPRVRAAVEDLMDLAGDPEVRFPEPPRTGRGGVALVRPRSTAAL